MLRLDDQIFFDSDAVFRWIRNGPYRTFHRDYDVENALADAAPHPFIDEAVVRIIDDGPATAREQMLRYLHLRPTSSLVLRGAISRWLAQAWLDDLAPSGQLFGKLVSGAAQHAFSQDVDVVRLFLGLGDRFDAKTEWTWMALRADPAGLGVDCLEQVLRSGVRVDDLKAGAIGVQLRDVPLPVVLRAAKALAGQAQSARQRFWSRLRQMRSDDLPGVEAALGLTS
jgi:hypothetical protein